MKLSGDFANGDSGLVDSEDSAGAIEIGEPEPVFLKLGDGWRVGHDVMVPLPSLLSSIGLTDGKR